MQDVAQERLLKVRDGVQKLVMYRDLTQKQIDSARVEMEKSKYEAELHQKCSELFKSWLEDSMEKNVNSISELVTSGLRHVIHDQEISFKIKQESKNNRLAMKFVLEQGDVEGDPLASFGGGPAVLISLILRLAIMTRMKMGNLLILDESLASMANVYVPSTASFIRKLAEHTGINILMVTHNPEYLHEAHTAYEGHLDNNNGSRCLSLKRLRLSESQ